MGVDYDLEATTSPLAALVETRGGRFDAVRRTVRSGPWGTAPASRVIDALTTYLMVRDHRPAHHLEIGSGLSTYYAWLAAAPNRRDRVPAR